MAFKIVHRHLSLPFLLIALPILMLPMRLIASDSCIHSLAVETIEVSAPFEMPAISIPDFSKCPKFSITDYGAKQESKMLTAKAIADAILAAHSTKGGIVIIPAGEWKTGRIHLKSNVSIHLKKGAVLTFSSDPKDYLPAVKTTWEGMECFNYSPLIYAYNCKNVSITGKGTLRANLDVWKVWYARSSHHLAALKRLYEMASTGVPVEMRQMVSKQANLRPQFIQFNRCENVLLEGVTIQNSPFWAIHPFMSKHVVIRRVSVFARGHNNDGVDPEMSQNVLIEECLFDQGDDAISIKSGRNQDAWRLNTPAKNIVIRNCYVRRGHQLLSVGSELSGGVENVLIQNCEIDPTIKGVGHLLYIKTNERRGGYVKNIHMRNISAGDLKNGILGIQTNVFYQWKDLVPTYEVQLTSISNIHVSNIEVKDVKYLTRIEGNTQMPVQDVSLENVTAQTVASKKHSNRNINNFITSHIKTRARTK